MSLFKTTFNTSPQYYWRLPLYFDFRDFLYISGDRCLTEGKKNHIQPKELIGNILAMEERV